MRLGFAPGWTRQRVQRVIAIAAIVSTAFIAGGLRADHGTFATWGDTRSLTDVTLSAAIADVAVTGFTDQTATYTADALSFTSRIVIQNTGSTQLQQFTATPTVVAGSSALWEAVATTFTAEQGGSTASWSTWLQGLVLDAGQSAAYDATLALTSGQLQQLDGDSVTVSVTVTAHASTSTGTASKWTASDATSTFTQTVDAPDSPPAQPTPTPTPTPTPGPTTTPGPNVNLTITQAGDHQLMLTWSNPVTALLTPGAPYEIYVNGIELPQNGISTYNTTYSLPSSVIPSALWPAVGQTAALTITIVPDVTGWLTGPIAQGTIWVQPDAATDALLFATNPN